MDQKRKRILLLRLNRIQRYLCALAQDTSNAALLEVGVVDKVSTDVDTVNDPIERFPSWDEAFDMVEGIVNGLDHPLPYVSFFQAMFDIRDLLYQVEHEQV